jgi:hypothetical protein
MVLDNLYIHVVFSFCRLTVQHLHIRKGYLRLSLIAVLLPGCLFSTQNKLKAELKSQGGDPNTAFNPFPVIFVGVGILVLAAGQGIFY